jgi:hypothetical protein
MIDPVPAEQQFEQFVYRLVPFLLGWTTSDAGKTSREQAGFDVVAEGPDGNEVFIETKLDTPSTSHRLQAMADQLQRYAEALRPSAIYLAVPGVVDTTLQEMLRAQGIGLWDGLTLRRAAEEHRVPIPPEIRLAAPVSLVKPRGMQLRKHLSRLERGQSDWRPYQQWCVDALTYLFNPPLELPLPERSNVTRVNRRDIILPNYAHEGFWAFMRTHYKADFVVVDAKNNSKQVKKGAILQLANYLTLHGTGLFGLVLTRVGASDSAYWTQREQWVLHNKLIVVLTDDDLRQMLTARDNGDEPETTIRQKIEDFRLGL